MCAAGCFAAHCHHLGAGKQAIELHSSAFLLHLGTCWNTYGEDATHLHGTIVSSCDACRAALEDNTLIRRAAQLDGCRQETLADGVHAVLCCHKCLKEMP